MGGVVVSVCNTVSLKVKQKLVAGQIKFDLSLVASLADGTPGGEGAVAALRTPGGTRKPLAVSKKRGRPYEVKKLKKAIARHWQEVSAAIRAGRAPDAAMREELLAMCEEYGQRADGSWQPLWQETQDGMGRLFELAGHGRFEEAVSVLTAINNQKKSCHKIHK